MDITSPVPRRLQARSLLIRSLAAALPLLAAEHARAIDNAQSAASAQPAASAPVEKKAQKAQKQDGTDDAQKVEIRAKRNEAETGFKASRSDTTSRSGNDLSNTPASVTVITSKVLETQQATSITEALENVSGVVVQQNAQGGASFSIRGYGDTYNNASTNVLSNGLSDGSATNANVFDVERIEVLKGPQAILLGGRSLGGGVNVVMKRPQAEKETDVTLQYGSHGDATVAVDTGGAIGFDDRLTARLIGSWAESNDAPGGYDGRKNYAFMPQLRWKDERTDIVVGANWGQQRTPANRYTFALDGHVSAIPSMTLGNRDDGVDTSQRSAFYDLEQKLTDHLTFVSKLRVSQASTDLHLETPLVALDPASGLILYTPTENNTLFHTLTGDHYLRDEFATGPVQHVLTVGFNHSHMRQTIASWEGDMAPVSVYEDTTPASFPAIDTSGAAAYSYGIDIAQHGVYVQDLTSWRDTTLLLGLRHTQFDEGPQVLTITGSTSTVTPTSHASSTTPSIGVVQHVAPWASVYASYTEGFNPNFYNNCAVGSGSKPRQTRNAEVGTKLDLLDETLSFTAAVFQVHDMNAPQYQSLDQCYTYIASEKTHGVEFDLQGRILPGWNAIANYTYSKITNPQDATMSFPGLPRNSASLWTTYDFQHPSLKGVGVALGVRAHGTSPGDSANSFTLPGGTRFDTSAFYKRGDLSLTLGVKNLFDRRLYGMTTTAYYIPVEDRRTVMFTIKESFR